MTLIEYLNDAYKSIEIKQIEKKKLIFNVI